MNTTAPTFKTAAKAEAYTDRLYKAAMLAHDRGDEHVICAARHYEDIAFRLHIKEATVNPKAEEAARKRADKRDLDRKRASFNKLCRGLRLL